MSEKRLTNKQLDDVDKFNNAIRGICRLVNTISANSILVDGYTRSTILFMESNPIDPIRLAGRHIRDNRDRIDNNDHEFFIDKKINNAIRDESRVIANLLDILTDKWPTLKEQEQAEFWKRLKIMNECSTRTIIL